MYFIKKIKITGYHYPFPLLEWGVFWSEGNRVYFQENFRNYTSAKRWFQSVKRDRVRPMYEYPCHGQTTWMNAFQIDMYQREK
jgi:hypothetical protein